MIVVRAACSTLEDKQHLLEFFGVHYENFREVYLPQHLEILVMANNTSRITGYGAVYKLVVVLILEQAKFVVSSYKFYMGQIFKNSQNAFARQRPHMSFYDFGIFCKNVGCYAQRKVPSQQALKNPVKS